MSEAWFYACHECLRGECLNDDLIECEDCIMANGQDNWEWIQKSLPSDEWNAMRRIVFGREERSWVRTDINYTIHYKAARMQCRYSSRESFAPLTFISFCDVNVVIDADDEV